MAGLLEAFCGLIIAGAVLALAVYASRRSHGEPRAAVATVAPRPRVTAAGGMAATVITAQPRGEITGPYGYDNGIAREET